MNRKFWRIISYVIIVISLIMIISSIISHVKYEIRLIPLDENYNELSKLEFRDTVYYGDGFKVNVRYIKPSHYKDPETKEIHDDLVTATDSPMVIGGVFLLFIGICLFIGTFEVKYEWCPGPMSD